MISKLVPAAALLMLLLAACANGPNAGAAAGSTGSAGPAGTGRPQPTSTPATEPASCPYDGRPIAIGRGAHPAPVCVHPGDVLTLTADPSPTQPWQPATSSDAAVLRCDSRQLADGALAVTCHAVAAGTVTVSTTTAAFAGDPHGPPQHTWTLTVQVE